MSIFSAIFMALYFLHYFKITRMPFSRNIIGTQNSLDLKEIVTMGHQEMRESATGLSDEGNNEVVVDGNVLPFGVEMDAFLAKIRFDKKVALTFSQHWLKIDCSLIALTRRRPHPRAPNGTALLHVMQDGITALNCYEMLTDTPNAAEKLVSLACMHARYINMTIYLVTSSFKANRVERLAWLAMMEGYNGTVHKTIQAIAAKHAKNFAPPTESRQVHHYYATVDYELDGRGSCAIWSCENIRTFSDCSGKKILEETKRLIADMQRKKAKYGSYFREERLEVELKKSTDLVSIFTNRDPFGIPFPLLNIPTIIPTNIRLDLTIIGHCTASVMLQTFLVHLYTDSTVNLSKDIYSPLRMAGVNKMVGHLIQETQVNLHFLLHNNVVFHRDGLMKRVYCGGLITTLLHNYHSSCLRLYHRVFYEYPNPPSISTTTDPLNMSTQKYVSRAIQELWVLKSKFHGLSHPVCRAHILSITSAVRHGVIWQTIDYDTVKCTQLYLFFNTRVCRSRKCCKELVKGGIGGSIFGLLAYYDGLLPLKPGYYSILYI